MPRRSLAMAPSGARIVPGLSRRIALAMGVGARADAGAKRLYPAEGGGVGLDVVVVIAAAGAASRDRRRSAAGDTALNAASSLECTEANHERTSSSTSSRVGDSDGAVLGVSAGWAWSEKTFAGVFAGVGCVSLFPGVHAAAAATTAAAAAAFLTVGEKAPPVLAPSSKKSSAAPISAWKAVGEAERTGETGRGSTTGERRAGGGARADRVEGEVLHAETTVGVRGGGLGGGDGGVGRARGERRALGKGGGGVHGALDVLGALHRAGRVRHHDGLKRGGEERDSVLVRQGRVLLVDVKHAGLLR